MSDGDLAVLRLVGELDLDARERCLAASSAVVADAPETVLVDLQHLAFIDSTGLQALFHAKRLADDAGVRLAILNGSGIAHRLLTMSGMDHVLGMVDARISGDPLPAETE